MGRIVGVQCTMCGARGVLKGTAASEFEQAYPSGGLMWCGRRDCPGLLAPWPSEAPGRPAWSPIWDGPGRGPEAQPGRGPPSGDPTRRRPS